jgi:hypothetical protein
LITLSKLPERIASKIEPEPYSGCWLWTGAGRRYGQIDLGPHGFRVIRVLYEMYIGGIEKGKELDHLCRTPFCVNPLHLEPVTHKENCRRGKVNQFVDWTHCSKGHKYTPETSYLWRNERRCRICSRARRNAWAKANPEKIRAFNARRYFRAGD